MDKKRRKKTSLVIQTENTEEQCTLYTISELVTKQEQCGILSKKFRFFEEFGIGSFQFHRFEGLYISIFDVILEQDLHVAGHLSKNFLELSFLIEGEQIIKIEGISEDLVCESQECYLVYLSDIQGSISYHKRKRLKEIKIRMSKDFIKRHQLNNEYDIFNRYSIFNLQKDFLHPLCVKTQDILTEILSDKRKGLLKRLFLESKTLELITLQLDDQSTHKPIMGGSADNFIKKLYQAQHLISSDLSVQYSIQQLSRQLGLNDFMLKKEFKRVFGKTIFEYATDLRMNKAKQLLHHSNKPIYEISELVGYKNSTHFTAAFKKIEGITPKKYRNNNEKNIT
ncbi:AraC family transcriptional regulator [Aquimarina sp. 2201CG5-10]|uniref:helix-turn-helix transcriptional regulator n=1 Tax=Aquimarina callyspongiae TaxID=3098150 RepID=UPI002AB4CBF2|nr:AraC family transcriptional regulator [Aquimarina sp. 2201CG5-10]MDY8135943.1 AraC family transcriptional regulator [Aquimarina sp. 2201CG5-10]